MSTFGDGLDKAVQKAFTRPTPKSAGAQMRYLVKQYKGTKAVAQMLRISQRTVERYVKDQIKKPRPDLAARLETEVKKRWQPQIRAKARDKAASIGGIVIDTRARLGYVAPIGQQCRGAVHGDDFGFRERLGEQARDHAGATADV
ncbi:hypothetical protein ABZS62_38100, partial [Streptomyces sp900116325]